MLKLTILSLFVLVFSSCHQKTLAPEFLTAQSTNTPPNGVPSNPPEIILTSSIDYNTNTITEDSYLVDEQATYTIPAMITAAVGNTGQGWLQLEIDNIRYCYMGDSKNMNQVSLIYNLSHSTTDIIKSCSSSLDTNLAPNLSVELFNGDTLIFKLENGICGNKCLDTEVALSLIPII